MTKVTVKRGQTIMDISVQETGTIGNSVTIAAANGYNITEDLTPGMELSIPDNLPVNRKVKDYYTTKRITPATQ